MGIRIAIVDDLKEDIDKLEHCIEKYFEGKRADRLSVERFSSAEDYLPEFSPEKYDLVFLDICMDEMNGIELAKKLREEDARLMIVFQTTEREYAFDAFPVHPFDYLIKPCRQDEVDGVLTEAQRVLEAGDPAIDVVAKRVTYSVPLRSIVAVVSSGHNVELLITNNQHIISTETFKSIAGKIEEDPRFLAINRGVVINMDHVLSPRPEGMEMKDGTLYPIRVNGRAAVLSEFSQYMISKVDKRG